MTRLTPEFRRLLAVLLLCLVGAALVGVVVLPLVDTYRGREAAIAERRELLGRYQAVADRVGGLQSHLASLLAAGGTEETYLATGPEGVVAAQLQNRIKSIIEKSGASLQSAQVLPIQEDGGFRRVGLRLRMTANIVAVHGTLHALEAGKPYLFLDNVDIVDNTSRARDQAEAGSEKTFAINADVYGYIRPE